MPGGRLTFEDAYAWSKFARTVMNSDDVDFRSRTLSSEERMFLSNRVAGSGLGVTYKDLEKAGHVLLVALEPEDEAGQIFLRLRKGVLAGTVKVATVAPFTSHGSHKLGAQVLHAAPGTEVEVVSSISAGAQNEALAAELAGGVILVGERAARCEGLLTAVAALADRVGARLQWVPRRAGDRAALEAGLLAIRVDVRRGEVVRRMAGNDPQVNEEWITDKDRFAFEWSTQDRLTQPLVRENGELVPTSWSDALHRAAEGLKAAREAGRVGFLTGGRLTFEDAYAWSKFARTVMKSDDIDFRSRTLSREERMFLSNRVAGSGLGVTYSDIEKAGQVLLVALEPEDEAGQIFLRLRKGVLAGSVKVATVAPFTTRGSHKLGAKVLHAAPGTEVEVVSSIADGAQNEALAVDLAGGVILVGERAARCEGLLTAVAALADRVGARLQWVPRRAGDRAALEAGLLPGLLPFGRPLEDEAARADLGWKNLPAGRGSCSVGQCTRAAKGEVTAFVVGGVDLRDFADPKTTREALNGAQFLVSLEVRASEVTEMADVVLPVAPTHEKHGTFINWEGRLRPFGQAVSARSLSDRDVLCRLAAEFGVDLGLARLTDVYDEVNGLMSWAGARVALNGQEAPAVEAVPTGHALLATHKPMLDAGRMQDGAPELAGTARRSVAFLSKATLESLGIEQDALVTLSTERGSITLPAEIADLPDAVVWVPECSADSMVHMSLGTG